MDIILIICLQENCAVIVRVVLGAPLLLKPSASSNDTKSTREEAPSAKLTKLMTFKNTQNIIYLDFNTRSGSVLLHDQRP